MNGTLTLKNPVMINGDKITEMKYDTNEIDGVLFATAEAKRKAAAGMNYRVINFVLVHLDTVLVEHFTIGIALIDIILIII